MRRARGFTLVEVLVAISLLSVVMLGLGAALRTMGDAEQRIDQRISRADEMRMAAGFMRSALARVSWRQVVPPPPARPGVLFGGTPQSVTWVGVMPARFGAGGRYFFRIAPEDTAQGRALVVRFTPWKDQAAFPDWSQAEGRVLVKGVQSLRMVFFDGEAVQPAWVNEWTATDRTPDRVLIELETAQGAWPPLFLPLRPLPSSMPGAGGAVFGPS
jgi:general secretion pathway protein J